MSDGMAGFIAASMNPCNYPNIPEPMCPETLKPVRISMTEAQQRAYDQAQVMLAFSQGKKVEYRDHGSATWCPITGCEPVWNWQHDHYRIAPEPQEVWLWVHPSGDKNQVGGSLASIEQEEIARRKAGYTKKLFREVLDA